MFFKKHRLKKYIKHQQEHREEICKRLEKTNWLRVLENIENHKSYYVGGGLFVDLPEGCFGLHLSGCVTEFGTGETRRLSKAAHRKVFEVYKRYKGETGFYRTNLNELEK